MVMGETPYISEYIYFGFYDWVTYRSNAGLGKLSIGRWMGVYHKVVQLVSYCILTVSETFISCVNVQRLTEVNHTTEEYMSPHNNFDEILANRLDANDKEGIISEVPKWDKLSLY